jgi:hypothetical protein
LAESGERILREGGYRVEGAAGVPPATAAGSTSVARAGIAAPVSATPAGLANAGRSL